MGFGHTGGKRRSADRPYTAQSLHPACALILLGMLADLPLILSDALIQHPHVLQQIARHGGRLRGQSLQPL